MWQTFSNFDVVSGKKSQNTIVILIFQNFKGNKNWFLTELRETTFGLSYQEV